ncbi:hypothetical protein [Variovorax boronicumulans]|uniref:hypothetical protein n=1 Tax=Variovorax boronicumulans TaxID=436515 RepID=UPI003399C05D
MTKPVVTVAYENTEITEITSDPLAERVKTYERQAEALCDLLRDTEAARLDTLKAARAMFASGFALLNGAVGSLGPTDSIRLSGR